jgi:hypothetical protein
MMRDELAFEQDSRNMIVMSGLEIAHFHSILTLPSA